MWIGISPDLAARRHPHSSPALSWQTISRYGCRDAGPRKDFRDDSSQPGEPGRTGWTDPWACASKGERRWRKGAGRGIWLGEYPIDLLKTPVKSLIAHGWVAERLKAPVLKTGRG